MKVIRDAGGKLINIGDWDFGLVQKVEKYTEVAVVERDGEMVEITIPSERPVFDEQNRPVMVVTNPLPEGAYEDEAEIVTGWDGGLYEATDPRRLGNG